MGTADRTINLMFLNAGAGMLFPEELNRKGRNHDLPFFFFLIKSPAFSHSLKVMLCQV